MKTRPPEPQFLVDYREWIKAGPPKCCHTCDHYDHHGKCFEFDMTPPDEFAADVDACPQWVEAIPF